MQSRTKSVLAATLVVGVWLSWLVGVLLHGDGYNLIDNLGLSSNYATAGQFGDAFGPLSSLMAALAAIGAWFALQQSKSQAFESTFYSLLAHHNSIVASIDIVAKTKEKDGAGKTVVRTGELFQGRDAYRRLLRSLRLTIAGMKRATEEQKVLDGYKRFFERYEDELAHYFRTLYHIVKFIERAPISNKEIYIKILRAQLSNSEQILLMYNCVAGKGYWKFKELVESYSLLHNVRLRDDVGLWEEKIIKPALNPQAFRDSDAEIWPSANELVIWFPTKNSRNSWRRTMWLSLVKRLDSRIPVQGPNT